MDAIKAVVSGVIIIVVLFGIGFALGWYQSERGSEEVRAALERTEDRLREALEAARKSEKYIQFLETQFVEDQRRLKESRRRIEDLRKEVAKQDELIDSFGEGIGEGEAIIRRIESRNEKCLESVRRIQEAAIVGED